MRIPVRNRNIRLVAVAKRGSEEQADALDEAGRTPLTSGPDSDPERRPERHLWVLVSGDAPHGDSSAAGGLATILAWSPDLSVTKC